MSISNSKKRIELVIECDGENKELCFEVGIRDYNRFVNNVSHDNKVAPAHNFCMQTVVEKDKPALQKILTKPGTCISISGAIIEEYQPDIEVSVKKSGPASID
uniref:Phage tail assembly chaperone n=1 Tax=Candidatus Kentrum sp. LFY TaxID=2126342 RepID=A0A450WI54_9GAMM|nr:MAG: Phage tail assembly chaperone [Candidatus Kentron sp. LFY]